MTPENKSESEVRRDDYEPQDAGELAASIDNFVGAFGYVYCSENTRARSDVTGSAAEGDTRLIRCDKE